MVKKVIIVGHDNYGAREIFTEIVDAHPDIEFLLIITTGLYYKKSFIGSILKILKESSIIFCLYRFIDILKYKIKGDMLCFRAKKRNIPIYYTNDINSADTHSFIKKSAADIIISTFTMHIYKQSTIDLPKIGTIGCHPSILPNYRGLEIFFWALANGEVSSGVSVFYLAEKIDGGRVIMQEEFAIDHNETVESIYIKLTKICGRLLARTLEKFKKGETLSIIDSSGKGSYYPMPTREAYKKFKSTGRKLR